jgi:diguanylate cyclase (GGDEF)-like protein
VAVAARGTTKRRWASGGLLVLVILLAGLAGAWWASGWVRDVQHRYSVQLVNQHAAQVEERASSEIHDYVDGLADLATAAGSHTDFTGSDFASLTAGFDPGRLPGADFLHYVVATDSAGIAGLQEWASRQNGTDVVLRPETLGPEHFFVVLSHPVNPDATAPLGRDLSSPVERPETLRLARDSGTVFASRTYRLGSEARAPVQEDVWFLDLVAPVIAPSGLPDAGQFRGWVVARLRVGAVTETILGSVANSGVNIKIYEEPGSGSGHLIAEMAHGPWSADSDLTQERIVTVGEREWRLVVSGTEALLSSTDRQLARLVLGVLSLAVLMLAVVVALLLGGRARALTRVDQATAALRVDIERRKKTETLLRERESQLRHLAFHDPLTGLANRALFTKITNQAIVRNRYGRDMLAIFYVDLDRFKAINDELGHGVGDAVLIETASRLRESIRLGDTVARLGGDEFAILSESVKSDGQIRAMADRILLALAKPYDIDGQPVSVTGSVGISTHERSAAGLDQLLRDADNAMYAAKARGRGRYVVAETGGRVEAPDEAFAGGRQWREANG